MPDDFLAEARREYRKAIEQARIARVPPYVSLAEAARAGEAVLKTRALYGKAEQAERVRLANKDV